MNLAEKRTATFTMFAAFAKLNPNEKSVKGACETTTGSGGDGQNHSRE